MTNHVSPFSLDQIGFHTVRFSSTGIFETHKDQMVDPYAATRIPKGAQVEGTQHAPQTGGIFPTVVLLHDRWGFTSQIGETAKRLACEGYVVLVPNLYGRQGGMITANAEVADALMERLNEKDAMQDINACCELPGPWATPPLEWYSLRGWKIILLSAFMLLLSNDSLYVFSLLIHKV